MLLLLLLQSGLDESSLHCSGEEPMSSTDTAARLAGATQ